MIPVTSASAGYAICNTSPETFPSRYSRTATWSAQAAPPETRTVSGVTLDAASSYIAWKSAAVSLAPASLRPAVPIIATFGPSGSGARCASSTTFSACGSPEYMLADCRISASSGASPIVVCRTGRSGVGAVVIFSGADPASLVNEGSNVLPSGPYL